MIASTADLVFVHGLRTTNIFSIFLVRDTCIERVGMFDEAISPNYAYYEDNDYMRRINLAGNIVLEGVHTLVDHLGSQTIAAFDSKQKFEHHRKFEIARKNYIKKWGGMPTQEKYLTPYNKK